MLQLDLTQMLELLFDVRQAFFSYNGSWIKKGHVFLWDPLKPLSAVRNTVTLEKQCKHASVENTRTYTSAKTAQLT